MPRPGDARAALQADPSTENDREALAELSRLTIDASTGGREDVAAEVARLSALRDGLDAAHGRARLAAARRLIDGDATRGLEAAREATAMLRDDADAWEMRAWFELRSGTPEAAAESLRRAISLGPDPDVRRETARAWMRIFRCDPALLDAPPP